MGAKYTEAQARAAAKYHKEHTSVMSIRVSKEKRAMYQAEADKAGKSLSAFIIDIVDKKIAES